MLRRMLYHWKRVRKEESEKWTRDEITGMIAALKIWETLPKGREKVCVSNYLFSRIKWIRVEKNERDYGMGFNVLATIYPREGKIRINTRYSSEKQHWGAAKGLYYLLYCGHMEEEYRILFSSPIGVYTTSADAESDAFGAVLLFPPNNHWLSCADFSWTELLDYRRGLGERYGF